MSPMPEKWEEWILNLMLLMLRLGCILWMKELIQKQTLQLWQEEDWRNLKCRPFQTHQCKLSRVQFVNLLSTWWKSVLRCQRWEKCLGIKKILLDNSSLIIMLHIATPTIQIGGTIRISLGSQGHLNTRNLAKHPRKPQVLNNPFWILTRLWETL